MKKPPFGRGKLVLKASPGLEKKYAPESFLSIKVYQFYTLFLFFQKYLSFPKTLQLHLDLQQQKAFRLSVTLATVGVLGAIAETSLRPRKLYAQVRTG